MMLYTHVAAGIVGALVAATGAWQVQNWRHSNIVAQIERKHTNELRDSLAKAQANFQRVNDASADAEKRAQVARRDAANARSELERLRYTLTPISVPAPADSCRPCVDRANSLAELFGQCAVALEELAGKADRHINDIQTLKQAWPK